MVLNDSFQTNNSTPDEKSLKSLTVHAGNCKNINVLIQ